MQSTLVEQSDLEVDKSNNDIIFKKVSPLVVTWIPLKIDVRNYCENVCDQYPTFTYCPTSFIFEEDFIFRDNLFLSAAETGSLLILVFIFY